MSIHMLRQCQSALSFPWILFKEANLFLSDTYPNTECNKKGYDTRCKRYDTPCVISIDSTCSNFNGKTLSAKNHFTLLNNSSNIEHFESNRRNFNYAA